ncbi:MAG: hypothetical protein ACRDDY_19260 [Clostridium sp.]|uniref:hypothetical protein n=1 Tax=Clostridium sp. TaxID=1506 RepID=UPI003EE6C1BB
MVIILWMFFAIVTAMVASAKNRSIIGWGITGFFFGIFALIAIGIIPKKETPM